MHLRLHPVSYTHLYTDWKSSFSRHLTTSPQMVDSGCFLIHVCTDCGSGFPLIRENPSQSVTHRKTTRSMHRIHTGRLLTFVPPLRLWISLFFLDYQLIISFIKMIQLHLLTKGIQPVQMCIRDSCRAVTLLLFSVTLLLLYQFHDIIASRKFQIIIQPPSSTILWMHLPAPSMIFSGRKISSPPCPFRQL